MTEERDKAAFALLKAAREYRKLYHEHEGEKFSVVWIEHNETGEGVFITNALNTETMKTIIERSEEIHENNNTDTRRRTDHSDLSQA